MGPTPSTTDRGTRTTRVLLIGERFLLIDALRAALTSSDLDVAAIGTARDDIKTAISAFGPDAVLYDASQTPIAFAVRIVQGLAEDNRMVGVLTADGISVEAALLIEAGAHCALGLDSGFDDLADNINRCLVEGSPIPLDRRYALEELLRGHHKSERTRWLLFEELTSREKDIFSLFYQGLSASQIADDACVSVSTVRSHIRNILTKLNVNSQLAAVAMARSNGWFSPDSLGPAT